MFAYNYAQNNCKAFCLAEFFLDATQTARLAKVSLGLSSEIGDSPGPLPLISATKQLANMEFDNSIRNQINYKSLNSASARNLNTKFNNLFSLTANGQ